MTRPWLVRPCCAKSRTFERPVEPESYGPCRVWISIVRLMRWFYIGQLTFALPLGLWWIFELYRPENSWLSTSKQIVLLVYMLFSTIFGILATYNPRPFINQAHSIITIFYLVPIFIQGSLFLRQSIAYLMPKYHSKARASLEESFGIPIQSSETITEILFWSAVVLLHSIIHICLLSYYMSYIYDRQLEIERSDQNDPFVPIVRSETSKRKPEKEDKVLKMRWLSINRPETFYVQTRYAR